MYALVLAFICVIVACQPDGKHTYPFSPPSAPPKVEESELPDKPPPSTHDEPIFPKMGLPSTREQLELYRQTRQQIWNSHLGHLFQEFISKQVSRDEVLKLSSDITERVFSVPGEDFIRIAAIQIMVEDCYRTGVINLELSNRIALLENQLIQKRLIINSVPIDKLLSDAPYFIALGILMGSPLVAAQTRILLTALRTSASRAWLARRLGSFFPLEAEGLNLKRLFSAEFSKGYKPLRALNSFISTFGPYSFAYIYFIRRQEPYSTESGRERLLFAALEEFLAIAEL